MARHTRGVLPLALLIGATLLGGVVLAIIRGTEAPEIVVPTTPPPTTTTPPPTTVSPTESPTELPTATPTETPTPSPTEEPTEEPTEVPTEPAPEPTEPADGEVLAETGGPAAPFLLGGATMMGLAAAMWRLSRRPLD